MEGLINLPSITIMRKQTILILGGLPLLLASCSTLGLYTGKHINRAKQEGRTRGVAEEQARAARAQYMAQQTKLEQPQSESTYYDIPVEAHTAPDGVKYEATRKTIKVTNK